MFNCVPPVKTLLHHGGQIPSSIRGLSRWACRHESNALPIVKIMKRFRKQLRPGVTLLEVILAIVILGMSMSAIAQLVRVAPHGA